MVENPRGCVLQWAGHAGYVTERFSGLLARQALVDVTLICEEQKLRVHKLVLASNSVYFEEILQHDLGEEPVIFLKDLSFQMLKAMVEFMYCGETTISQELLPSLLAATKTFKVKELELVINSMMTSSIENFQIDTHTEVDVNKSKIKDSKHSDADYINVRYNDLKKGECFLLCNRSNSDANPNENQSLESNVIVDTLEHELEHTLYEEPQDLEANNHQVDAPFLASTSTRAIEDKVSAICAQSKLKEEVPTMCSTNTVVTDDIYCTDDELKPILYEQCCDLSDIDECEESSMSLSRSCLQQIEKDFAQYSFDRTDVPGKVRKCVKVYTHKRRKSTDDMKNKLADMNSMIQSPPSTNCIDLLEEPSTNDIPVTLLTSLDMESAEYIISLSTENIQSIVGATLNNQQALNKCKDIEHVIDYNNQKENVNKKELISESTENTDDIKPILRRSLRLNQQEADETVNNSESIKESSGKERHKKSCFPNRTELYIKGKRKTKDADRKVPEQAVNNVIQSNKRSLNNSRTHKNTTKLMVKRSTKSVCAVSGKGKDEQKSKTNGRIKCETSEKFEMDSCPYAKLNTIEHINRSLWGDMSDISEDCESNINLSEYTSNTEIPFAVGLLPLRTALEKMQATPDYQPRKTRSSVAPIRHDINSLKRKNCSSLDNAIISKKQNNYTGDPKENANTVCHIQIRTAPSQYIRNRKKFLTTGITTLEPSIVMNKQ